MKKFNCTNCQDELNALKAKDKMQLKGKRKFIIMATVLVSAIGLLLAGYLNGREFADLIGGGIIAFFSSNVGEHITGTIQKHLEAKSEQKSN